MSLIVLLNISYCVPVSKIKEFFADLIGLSINEGTIINAINRAYSKLERTEALIRNRVCESLVAHFDETGFRVKGTLHWLHGATSSMYTYLFLHVKRGLVAMKSKSSILPDFTNWGIHDCIKSYFNSAFNFKHGICGAHIIRELYGLEENGSKWAVSFRRLLFALFHMTDEGKGELSDANKARTHALYDKLQQIADDQEPPPKKIPGKRGRPKATKGRNLYDRLKELKSAILAFAFRTEIPFTNNQGERDLRPSKTKQKVSGCFRTLLGAEQFARIQGFISTARKQKKNVLTELRNTFNDHNFILDSN